MINRLDRTVNHRRLPTPPRVGGVRASPHGCQKLVGRCPHHGPLIPGDFWNPRISQFLRLVRRYASRHFLRPKFQTDCQTTFDTHLEAETARALFVTYTTTHLYFYRGWEEAYIEPRPVAGFRGGKKGRTEMTGRGRGERRRLSSRQRVVLGLERLKKKCKKGRWPP